MRSLTNTSHEKRFVKLLKEVAHWDKTLLKRMIARLDPLNPEEVSLRETLKLRLINGHY